MLRKKALLVVFIVAIIIVGFFPLRKLIISSRNNVAKLGKDAITAVVSRFSSSEKDSTEIASEVDSKADSTLVAAGAALSEPKAETKKVKKEKDEKAIARAKVLAKIDLVQDWIFWIFVLLVAWFMFFHRYWHVMVPVPKNPVNRKKAEIGLRPFRFKNPFKGFKLHFKSPLRGLRLHFRKSWKFVHIERLPLEEEPFVLDEFSASPDENLEDEQPDDGSTKKPLKEYMRICDLSSGDIVFILVFFVFLLIGWGVSNYFETREPYGWLPNGTYWIGIFIYVFTLMINALLVFASYFIIPARQRWIQEFFGKEQTIMLSGLHFRIPLKHNKDVSVVLKKETKEGDGKKKTEEAGTIISGTKTIRVYWWETPEKSIADLRENIDDLTADDVVCADGWKPKVDLVLASSVADVDPTIPIRGAGMREQPPYKHCYNFKRLDRLDKLTQGIESEADAAVRQWASLIPYVVPYDTEDADKYQKRMDDKDTEHLVALNQSQYYLSLAVFYRLMGDFGFEKDPDDEAKDAMKAVKKQVPVAVIEHICPKGGLILRSVQIKKVNPPEDFDKLVTEMRKEELAAKGRIMKARGDKEYLEIVATGQADAVEKRGKAYGGAIKEIATTGVSPDRAATSFETLEGQGVWKEVVNSPNKMIIAGGQQGVANVATGAEILADALKGSGVGKSGTEKSEADSKDTSDDKPEGGKSE